MSSDRISPEQVMNLLNRFLPPSERALFPEARKYPTTVYANERLFGVPVYIYGEGTKGSYLRHSYYDVAPNERIWQIECGSPVIYGKIGDVFYPLFANGMPTIFVFKFKPEEYEGFYAEGMKTTEIIEVKESQITNLDRVMQLKDSILVIDRHNLLFTTPARKLPEGIKKIIERLLLPPFSLLLTDEERKWAEYLLHLNANIILPSDIIDQLIEKNKIIETLNRAIWEFQRRIMDYETNVNIMRSENTKIYELLSYYGHKFSQLGVEVTNMQKEMIRLRDELTISMKEAESLEDAKKRLINAIDVANSITESMQKLAIFSRDVADTISSISSRLVEITDKAKEIDFLEAMRELKERGRKTKKEETEKPKGEETAVREEEK